VPPAWTDVWIAPSPNAHLQATGRDKRGRKQYRYHPRWREARDETKFERMVDFARALPRLRRRVRDDLREADLPRDKVLAAIVRLLDASLARIGNLEYARENESFGLTTLREEHVEVRGPRVRLRFRGKHGKEHDLRVEDPRLARVVRRLQDLPGQELFQFHDERGELRLVHSHDVNEYIREAAGEEFSAKDFRTWAGTVLAARELLNLGQPESEADAKRKLVEAIKAVAGRLGDTPAVTRASYIHPEILLVYAEGRLLPALERDFSGGGEAAVLALLRKRSSHKS
jgi:DNA topoisomerase I